MFDHLALPLGRPASIHVARYPSAADFATDADARRMGDEAIAALQLVRRYKSTNQLSMVAALQSVEIEGLSFDPATMPRLVEDLAKTCRASVVRAASGLSGDDVLAEGALRVRVVPEGAKVPGRLWMPKVDVLPG